MTGLFKLANRLLIQMLRLHPLAGTSDFYEEMRSTYAEVINESSAQGRQRPWQQMLAELLDLPTVILRSWIFGRKAMAELLTPPDEISTPTPWKTALLSLLPFFWLGPVMLCVGYLPFWSDPLWAKWIWPGEGILIAAIFLGGSILGARRGFPRWSYPYVMMVLIALITLANELLRNTPLHNQQLLVLLVVLIASTAVTLRWRPFRTFWAHIRQDWTHLSYGLFAIIILLASSVDHDETPRLTVQVLLPSLLALTGALVHLRSPARKGRILALVISLTLALPVWLWPIFDGMMRSPSSRAEILSFYSGAYFILLGILLAPALIGLLRRARPDKETVP